MDEKEILLKEYEACQQHNISIGNQVWTSTTIFFTASVTLLVGIVYATLTSDVFSKPSCTINYYNTPIIIASSAITLVGIGMMIIICKWISWLKRQEFLTQVNYERSRDIELNLGMSKNKIAVELDSIFDKKSKITNKQVPDIYWAEILKVGNNINYSKPAGFPGLRCMAWTIFSIWGIFVLGIITLLILKLMKVI
jgi:hypothetical protein